MESLSIKYEIFKINPDEHKPLPLVMRSKIILKKIDVEVDREMKGSGCSRSPTNR